jgi:DNA adenine methylase
LPDLLLEVCRRLKPSPGNDVQIENRDAFLLIEKYDRPNVLMYLDPPYLLSTRKNRKIYSREMSDNDHIRLCSLLASSRAHIVLSGYDNDLYNACLPGFNKTLLHSVDEAGNKKTEVLWRNFSEQEELFAS